MYNQIRQYKQIFYVITILILLGVLGYFLADTSWNTIMDTLTATEIPSPPPTLRPTPVSIIIGCYISAL